MKSRETQTTPPVSATASSVPPPSDAYDAYLSQRVSSHDGRAVAVTSYDRSAGRSRLVLERSGGLASEVLVDMRSFNPVNSPQMPGAPSEIGNPSFSADDAQIFFLTDAWATDHALFAVDVAAKTIRYLVPTNAIGVVSGCANEAINGALLVTPHHGATVLGFGGLDPLDWTFLIKPSGALIGLVDDDSNLFDTHCKPLPGAAHPKPVHVRPPRIDEFPCGSQVLRVHTVYSIDGRPRHEYSYYEPTIKGFMSTWTGPETMARDCPARASALDAK